MQGSLCQISRAKNQGSENRQFSQGGTGGGGGVVIEFVPQDYPEWNLYRLHPLDQESLFVSQG